MSAIDFSPRARRASSVCALALMFWSAAAMRVHAQNAGDAAPEAGASSALPPAPASAPPPPPSSAPPSSAPPPASAPCPVCDHGDARVEGTGAFILGVGVFDLSSLNDRLAAAGYDRFGSTFALVGGRGRAVFDNGFVVGLMGAAILPSSAAGPDDFEAELSGGFGAFDLGFALVHSRSVLFTVGAALGGYGLELELHQHGTARFDDVLERPGRGTSLGRGGFLGGLTLEVEGKVDVGEAERGRQRYFSLGLRAGGLYGPPLGDWNLSEGSETRGDPDTGLTSLYVAITLGYGGRRVEP